MIVRPPVSALPSPGPSGRDASWLDGSNGSAGLPAVIAHRGMHETPTVPKNSLQALLLAAMSNLGLPVEMDVRRLGDGTLVIFHDPGTHLTGGRKLSELTWAEFHALEPDAPTLEQWASMAGGLGVDVLAELKEPGYEAEVLGILQRYVRAPKLVMMSFDKQVVADIQRIAPRVPVGLLTSVAQDRRGAELQIRDLPRRPDFVALRSAAADDATLDALEREGIRTFVWTVDGTSGVQRTLLDPRIDGIITDSPTKVRSMQFDLRRGIRALAIDLQPIQKLGEAILFGSIRHSGIAPTEGIVDGSRLLSPERG